MKEVFVDTGFFIALESDRDQYHDAAVSFWQDIARELPLLVTTQLVWIEVVTFFNASGAHAKAVDLGERLLNSESLTIVPLDEMLLDKGWRLLRERHDKQWSLADCIAFIVMRQRGINEALAFDRHFEQAGFVRRP
jgi:predicted nucleic acid-binding protein